MKKILSVVALISVMFVLTSCAAKLPEGMTEDEVKKSGDNIVTLLNEKSYDAILELCDTTMSEALTASPLSEAWEPFYSTLGTFEKIEKSAISSQNGYAVYVVQAKYANKSAVFTISLDTNYKLSGIYFK